MIVCTVMSVGRRGREVAEAQGGTSLLRRTRGRMQERQLRLQSSTARSMYCIMRHEDLQDTDEREERQSSERKEVCQQKKMKLVSRPGLVSHTCQTNSSAKGSPYFSSDHLINQMPHVCVQVNIVTEQCSDLSTFLPNPLHTASLPC